MPHDLTPVALDTEFTLPEVVSAGRGRYSRQALTLTIVFHPDTARIGEVARVPAHDPDLPWVLGRRSPVFAHSLSVHASGVEGESGLPLQDPHVSRRAITFEYTQGKLLLTRFASSSRVRLGGQDLREPVTLAGEALALGVPLLLGHAVVLMLRLVDVPQGDVPDYVGRDMLHGTGSAMQRLHQQIAIAAAGTDDVLIRGETGTGKELVAGAIHAASERSRAPLVSVNMAAIPTELAPSVLFGSARGAFTGADKDTRGYFEQASGGSLFLDEIGDCPRDVQPLLLRALQQREIQVVGGAVRHVDVRILSATDAPIEQEGSHFKAALLHRLGTYEIEIPPLREHAEDIGQLLWYFVTSAARECAREELLPHRDSRAIDLAAWAFLFFQATRYHWPGNIRELSNVARQVVLTTPDTLSLAERFEHNIARRKRPAPEISAAPVAVESGDSDLRRMADVSDAEFEGAMERCDFEPSSVAKALRVSRTAVYRRIENSRQYRLATDIPEPEMRAVMQRHGGELFAVASELRVSLAGLRQRLRALDSDLR